jgi:hypothetical protein
MKNAIKKITKAGYAWSMRYEPGVGIEFRVTNEGVIVSRRVVRGLSELKQELKGVLEDLGL